MQRPQISVLLPVYNGGPLLEPAIHSILAQTHRNFECILLNDGSTDGSLALMQRLAASDSRIRLISRENRGLIATLNEGLEACTGEFIARMDADDLSLPHRFERQRNAMEQQGLDICGGHYYVIDGAGKVMAPVLVPVHPRLFPVWMVAGTPFAHGSVMIRRAFLEKQGLRYDPQDSAANEDMVLWMRMYEAGARFGNVDELIFNYRWYPESFSHTKIRTMKNENVRLSRRFVARHRQTLLDCYRDLIPIVDTLSIQEKAFLVKSALAFSWFQKSTIIARVAAAVGPQIALVNILGQLNLIARHT